MGRWAAGFFALLMVGAALPCVLDQLYVMHELWAGVLIALSVLAYGMRRSGWGVALGFAALVVRELAAPYCVVCCLLAVSERRWREVAAWCGAAALYGLWYAAHVWQVLPRIGPNAVAHSDGWIRFGGAAFVISVAQVNAYLLQLPQWITGIYLALCAVGLRGLDGAMGPPGRDHRGGVSRRLCDRRQPVQSILGIANRPVAVPWRGPIARRPRRSVAASDGTDRCHSHAANFLRRRSSPRIKAHFANQVGKTFFHRGGDFRQFLRVPAAGLGQLRRA